MTKPDTHRTRSGRILTDEEIDALATEVAETDYDVEALKTRRRGRPSMGSGPADVVPVRIDPELRAAIEAGAEAEHCRTQQSECDLAQEIAFSPTDFNQVALVETPN